MAINKNIRDLSVKNTGRLATFLGKLRQVFYDYMIYIYTIQMENAVLHDSPKSQEGSFFLSLFCKELKYLHI